MREDFLVASLVDTNILIYFCDPRDPNKREAVRALLRDGQASETLLIPHQSLLEFVASVTRSRGSAAPLMTFEAATRQAELFMAEFPILYPNERIFRTALLARTTYRLSWFDAHLWAYADHYGLAEILSEDFQHDRMYGTVRIKNPFVALGLE
jgi:predicted nucleic acid-binding protein